MRKAGRPVKEGFIRRVDAEKMITHEAEYNGVRVKSIGPELKCIVQAYIVDGIDYMQDFEKGKRVFILYFAQNGKDGTYFSEWSHAYSVEERDEMIQEFKNSFEEHDCV